MNSKICMVAAACLFGLVSQTFAQVPQQIGKFKEWGTYKYTSKGAITCYILSVPTAQLPATVDHGDNYFMIRRMHSQPVEYEPQVEAGYQLKPDSKVTLSVDGQSFSLFTEGNRAWLEDSANGKQLMAILRAGQSMTISAESQRGTKTQYEYSLMGISAALNATSPCR
ncbi:invasion associated locus B family protein [Phyllobacterium myrsinacearum]|uniref:Uncharacterized protein n=1 Tax=Phyllobacterium myrsinacearum TaxID=28101 RepID=A0A839ER52_9HYPH|nr:invasion associated locus B family protein [Phyllobacterium myrsinacearum]MBA8879080.1 hypothetical protein [Phyllobacterium myrsinacearum]